MLTYVQTPDGRWHVKSLHPMGLTKLKEKTQLHFPHTRGSDVCPECLQLLREREQGESMTVARSLARSHRIGGIHG